MNKEALMKINWILLGLVMLVSGLLKVFVMGVSAVEGMLVGIVLFAWAPALWAWILIIGEIGSGAAILVGWNLKKIVWIPAIILVIATFTAQWGDWVNMLIHLALASNYLLLGTKK